MSDPAFTPAQEARILELIQAVLAERDERRKHVLEIMSAESQKRLERAMQANESSASEAESNS